MITNQLKSDTYSIYYELHGPQQADLPLLIFLHEGLGSVSQWKNFPKRLSHRLNCRILLYDRIGYGQSSPVSGIRETNYLHQEAAIYLPELLDHLGVDKPVNLFGHSDGATLALLFASIFPEMVNKLAIEAPHVIIEDKTANAIFSVIGEWNSGKLQKRMQKHHPNKADSMFWSWAGFWSNSANYSWSILEELKCIKSPLLFIQGHDDIFGTEHQAELVKSYISADYQELLIDGCGHIPHLEFEDLVLEETASFFLEKLM